MPEPGAGAAPRSAAALPRVLVVGSPRLTVLLDALAGVAELAGATEVDETASALAAARPDCVVVDGEHQLPELTAAHPAVPVVRVVADGRPPGDGRAVIAGLADAVVTAVSRARRRSLLRSTLGIAAAVLAALPDAALVRDDEGRVVLANEAAQELLGMVLNEDGDWLTPDVRLVEPDGEVVADEHLPTRRVLGTGLAEQGRLLGVLRPADGSTRWVEVDARPLVAEDTALFAVVESFRDVTARLEAERRSRYQARLLDVVGQAVIATDAGGTVEYWNAAAEALYGWTAQEALGRPVVELTPAEPSLEQAEEIMAALRAGLTWTGDFPVRRKDGTAFTALVSNRPLTDDEGDVIGVIGVSTDVTARVEAERAAQQLAAIVASTGDAVVLMALDGTIQSWNASAERLYGWSAAEAVGTRASRLVPPDRRDEVRALRAVVLAGEPVRDLRTVRLRRDGRPVEVALTVSPVFDAAGVVVAVSTITRDVTAQCELERALEHAALHDDLTGLPNRVLLSDRVEQAARAGERTDTPTSVLFVDVDGFKDVNDAQGHALGDLVLAELAHRLRLAVGPHDTVARFGGDEFVVLLPGAGRDEAVVLAERLLAAVREPLAVGGRRLHVSVSIGVAATPAVAAADLLRAADAAVYEAKARGRGQVVPFVGELSQRAEERLLLAAELRDALDDDRLHMVYQPVVELATGRVLGLEALVRWHHPARGPVPPNVFVPVAERTGLGRDLDAWVLRRSCLEAARLRRDGHLPADAYLAVNVTAANVVDPRFTDAVRAALTDSGLPAQALVLEVTENSVMNDLDIGVGVLTALTELGVRVAIDDFGTGWSSLVYVRRLPASILKLDRTFVSGLTTDDDDLAIAVSVVDLARSTGMSVVAEGIETAEQLAVLRRLGCAAGQGYLWMAGVDADELPGALASLAQRVPAQEAVEPVAACTAAPDLGAPAGAAAARVGAEHGLARLTAMHAEGASLATIAAALNREGWRAPSGQRWHPKSVARVLAEPTLARLVRS